MTRHFRAPAILIAALLVSTAAWAQSRVDAAVFSFNTDVNLSMSGYVLPPGQYSLERVGTTDVFRLHKGRADAPNAPIATIDTWNTQTPVPGDPDALKTEAVLTVVEPRQGETARVLEGFRIEGDYFKIRDVLAIDTKYLTSN